MKYVSPNRPWIDGDENLTRWHSRLNVALLKELAAVVSEIGAIDNDGWVLIGYRGQGTADAIVLNQWGLTSLTVVRRHVNLLVPSELAESLVQQHGGVVSKVGFPEGMVQRIEKLQPSQALGMLEEHRGSIHEAYRELQRRPNTASGTRRSEHRPELLETLSKTSGIDLRQPEYFEDKEFAYQHSGFWLMRDPAPPIVRPSTLPADNTLRLIWPKPDIDLSQFPASENEFKARLSENFKYSGVAADRVFQFVHGMNIGDEVALHSGIGFSRLASTGIVESDYIFNPDDSDYPHQRQIRSTSGDRPVWHQLRSERLLSEGPITVDENEWTLIQQPYEDSSQPETPDPGTPDKQDRVTPVNQMSKDSIRGHFAASGLNYSGTQIADFYTALQTKGFVVLSGISGTGKSKIATGFTELLPHATVTEIAGPDPVTANQSLRFNISPTETWAAVSADQSHLFPRISLNTRYDVNFVFEGAIYRGAYKTRTLNYGKPTLYFMLGKPLSQRLRRLSDEQTVYAQFRPAPNENALPEILITLEEAKPEASTQVVESIEVPNTLFLSVRPDWRDGTSLLGYYNPLTETYEWTEFLRFILNAAENYRSDNPIAWFVILDEMNLAHVEYYFADMLSVLESGRFPAGHENHPGFTAQPLRLTYPDIVANEAPPAEIHLPPNLYIVGTVNMDETTHAFSPKVLDRAFTMELTEVDFSDYPGNTQDHGNLELDDAAKHEFLQVFSQGGQFPQIRKQDIREYVQHHDEVRESLQRLNTALAEYRFHFGYRVFDEIVQFLANADDNEMYEDFQSALDSAAFMKILPKFSGSEARVGRPLVALIEWAQDPLNDGEDALSLTRTLDRAKFMQRVLQTDGFVTAF